MTMTITNFQEMINLTINKGKANNLLNIAANAILTLGAITAGSGYTTGSYVNVPLTGGGGTGATADITVSGGAVTAVTLRNGGANYAAANTLSAALPGGGSGFSIPVATVGAGASMNSILTQAATALSTDTTVHADVIETPPAVLKTNLGR